jgi:hypothetical protein
VGARAAGQTFQREPRWHAFVATAAAAGLSYSLPPDLMIVPRFALPAVLAVLFVPIVLSHRAGRHLANHVFGIAATAVLTLAVIASIVLLMVTLVSGAEAARTPTVARELLQAAASLWLSNILVFALWYWRLDAGGPNARAVRERHTTGAFLFPQMQIAMAEDGAALPWSPQFIDYLFLAFNTSTAFSPTDTPVLTRWGKGLMMIQSMISLTVLVLLAARAVNIL